jgi:hypothetical protein
MGRRILNRRELRADYDAAERRKPDEEERNEAEGEAGDDTTDELEAEETGAAEDQEEAEEAPKKPKPKTTRTRTRRTAKVTRMKVVWAVFNNSNQRVAVFDYKQRQEAEELASKLRADKKSTHFVQPVKEPLEEKPEA